MSFKPYSKIIIRDANLVNEGKQEFVDVLIQDGRIEKLLHQFLMLLMLKPFMRTGTG